MARPLLLDLFCGAGGCSMGYHQAGFDVIGVDIKPQKNYPFTFVQGDALAVLRGLLLGEDLGGVMGWPLHEFSAIHASPPCPAYSTLAAMHPGREWPKLIEPTRDLLEQTDLPWIIENVEGAPLENPVTLCGSMFDPPLDVQRHRLFETNWHMAPPTWPCRHKVWGPDRFPGGRSKERTGSSTGLVRGTVEVGSWDIPLARQKEAMGVDWDVTTRELSQAIPPAYTEFIGRQLIGRAVWRVAA